MKTNETIHYKERGLELLGLPPVQWWDTFHRMTTNQLGELSRWLLTVSERAARIAAYVDALHRGHAAAVDAQNRMAAKVRKALGYTIHRDDLRF